MRYGGILSESQTPTWSHGRLLLPTTKPEQLIKELSQALEEHAGALAQPAPESWRNLSPKSVHIKVIDTNLILLPEAGQVRVEMALGALDPKIALTEMAAQRQQPPQQLPNTPARTHLLEGAGIAGVYINMDRLMEYSVISGQQQLNEALRFASSDTRDRLYAAGLRYALYPALLSSPAEQNVTDVTFSVSMGASSEFRMTQSLTARSANAHQKASTQKGTTFAPLHPDPWLQVRVQANLQALIAATEPGWMQKAVQSDTDSMMQEAASILRDGGMWPMLYTALNQPSLHLAGLKVGDIDLYTLLPQSLSAVIEDVDFENEANPSATGGLLIEYPTGPLPSLITDNLPTLQEMSKTFMPWIKLSLDTKQEATHTHLTITLGDKTPAQIFALDKPITQGPDLTWKRRATKDKKTNTFNHLQNTGMLGIAGTLLPGDGVMETYKASQTVRARIDWAPPKTPAPALTAIRIPHTTPKAQENLKENACMVLSTRSTAQFLAAYSHATPDLRREFLTSGADAAQKELLSCVGGAQNLSPDAQNILKGRQLVTIELLARGGYREEAHKRATTLCETHPEACALAETLRPVYPEGSLTLPTNTQEPLPNRTESSHRLILSNEGVYLDGKRIADHARLNEGQEIHYPWLAEHLPPSNREAIAQHAPLIADQSAVELIVDRATPYKILRRVLHTLEGKHHNASLVFTYKGKSARLRLRLPSPNSQDGQPKAYLSMDPGSLRIIHNKKLAGAFPRSPALGGLGIDDKALTATLAKLRKTNPGLTLHLSIQAEIDTEATLKLVRLLHGTNLEQPNPVTLESPMPR